MTQRTIREQFVYGATEFRLTFDRPDGSGGYGFDCTPSGTPVFDARHAETQRRSYHAALSGVATGEFLSPRVEKHTHSWTSPRIVECDCGGEVELASSFANGCELCPAEYSGTGVRLAPRHQWGEETGEHFACGCRACAAEI